MMWHQLVTLLFLTSVCSVWTFPSRPLDERTSGFGDIIENESSEPPPVGKRIVAKSVFIAPNIYPVSTCKNNFVKHENGSCVEVHKIDQQGQLSFLTDLLLNMKKVDARRESPPVVASGPVQYNIPFVDNQFAFPHRTDGQVLPQDAEEHHHVAGSGAQDGDVMFVAPNAGFDPAKLRVKDQGYLSGADTTTTGEEGSGTATTTITTDQPTTVQISSGDEATSGGDDLTLTTVRGTDETPGTATTDDRQAIFFQLDPYTQNTFDRTHFEIASWETPGTVFGTDRDSSSSMPAVSEYFRDDEDALSGDETLRRAQRHDQFANAELNRGPDDVANLPPPADRAPNRRNRDGDFERLTPGWQTSSPQNSLVVKSVGNHKRLHRRASPLYHKYTRIS